MNAKKIVFQEINVCDSVLNYIIKNPKTSILEGYSKNHIRGKDFFKEAYVEMDEYNTTINLKESNKFNNSFVIKLDNKGNTRVEFLTRDDEEKNFLVKDAYLENFHIKIDTTVKKMNKIRIFLQMDYVIPFVFENIESEGHFIFDDCVELKLLKK